MKIYVSGPMTGLPKLNYPAFFDAETKLIEMGFKVSNPAQYPPVIGAQWEDYLRRDIKDLMDCDGLALLPGWTDSRGACLERDIAERLFMPIYPLVYWLNNTINRVETWNSYAEKRKHRAGL